MKVMVITMDKEVITEEMHLEKEWFAQAREQKLETLPAFMNHILNDYGHDYGTICHAISACALAAAYAADSSEQGGITGFQAGAVMWDFVRQWSYSNNKTTLRIIDYDNMLYPQYREYFEGRTISESTWELIQNEAKKRLEENGPVSKEVIEHWKNIVNGVIPFGFKIQN
jgi:hypothetical protein